MRLLLVITKATSKKKKIKDSTVKSTFKMIARNFQILLSALPLETVVGWIIGLATFFLYFLKLKIKTQRSTEKEIP